MARNAMEERNRGGRAFKRKTGADKYDLISEDGQKIIEVLDEITEMGGAIRIGRTRDGGALAIGVYGDGGEPYTDYLRPGESTLGYLRELRDAMVESTRKPNGVKQ